MYLTTNDLPDAVRSKDPDDRDHVEALSSALAGFGKLARSAINLQDER